MFFPSVAVVYFLPNGRGENNYLAPRAEMQDNFNEKPSFFFIGALICLSNSLFEGHELTVIDDSVIASRMSA